MSMHNLLELDDFGSPPPGRPKPKPRITATTLQHKPPPKPKRRIERDVDEVISMSSVSSGDRNTVQAAFDNPSFQADEVENKKSNPKSRVYLSESDSEISDRQKSKLPKAKSRRNNVDDANRNNSSSAWDETETYITIEHEVKEKPRPRTNKTKSPQSKSNPSSNTPIEEFIIQASPNKTTKSRKESHVSIEIEDAIKAETVKTNDDEEKPSKTSKPRLVERWKSFLKSGQSQSVDKSETKSEVNRIKRSKKEDEDEVLTISNKSKNPTEKPGVDLSSDDSSSDDEGRKDTKQTNESGEEELATKPDEKTSLKKSHPQIKGEKTRLRFNILGKSVSKEKLPTSSHQIEEIEAQNESEDAELPQRKRPTRTYKSHASGKDLLFGITIHSSDLLPLDPNILHPVVKVTLMNQEGKLLHRTCGFLNSQNKNEDDPNLKNIRRKGGKSSGKKNLSQSESIFPIMTQPFKMSHINPTFTPAWNELILFEEPFARFLDEHANVILFFEVMDFLPMGRTAQIPTSGYHGSEEGWYKIAWAFLKPVGGNGIFNVERKLRLQLFKPVKLRNKDVLGGPEVFSWWKLDKRDKLLNTTLYVTVKGVNPPRDTKASLKQLLSMRKEDLTEAILESQLATRKTTKISKKGQLDNSVKVIDKRKQIQWARLDGQSCKVPNKLVAALPSSQIQSLNINVSGNVHCLKFSPCGLKLAAGLDTDELHAVLIFEIPSGNLLRCLKNHHGLIYDLTWKQMDVDDDTYITHLASASADSTAIVWRMQNNDETSLKMIKKLHHPSYVYCVKFHPTHPSLLVTGCFDYIIRIWDIGSKDNEDNSPRSSLYPDASHDSCPLFILDRHYSFVNALLFDNSGSYLFSGDGNSCLYTWSIKSPTKRKTWKIHKDVKLSETGNIPINSLSLHPNGNRLLVHLRDNSIKILDVATMIQVQTFSGLVNDKLQIRSCFSPCGNLVLSGSEDPTICIWDADTSAIVQFLTPKNHFNCFVTAIDYHPFDFYMAVGLASPICEPSPILLYHYETLKLSNVATVQSSISKFKSNMRKKKEQKSAEQDNTSARKNVTFANVRGDSSEKFATIIHKLDKALKDVRDPTKYGFTDQGFPRSLSFDSAAQALPTQSERPNSVSGSERLRPEPKMNGHSSDPDITRQTLPLRVSKKKSKSPRTYIEDRLEELILPTKTTAENGIESQKEAEENTSSVQNETMLLSPKYLPKPRKRVQSPEVPIRSKPNISQKTVGDTSSSPTPENSPMKRANKEKFDSDSDNKKRVLVDVHMDEENKPHGIDQKEQENYSDEDQVSYPTSSPIPPKVHPRKYSKR